jgi:hypothetical protein
VILGDTSGQIVVLSRFHSPPDTLSEWLELGLWQTVLSRDTRTSGAKMEEAQELTESCPLESAK